MSERIYEWLLGLYPSHFRERYGGAALELFRDRSRDERGFFRKLQLWIDLLTDLAVSVPREHRCYQRTLVEDPAQHSAEGAPSFQMLERESLRPGALLLGGLVSLVAMGALPIVMSRAGNHVLVAAAAIESTFTENVSAGGLDQSADLQTAASPSIAANGAAPDSTERHRVLAAAILNLKQYYVSREVAEKMADSLLAHEQNGDDNGITDGGAFANLITQQMRAVSGDNHLEMVFSETPTPDRPPEPTPETLARYAAAMKQNNCTFEEVKILPNNIGYLKLNSFPDIAVCRTTAAAAMASLNRVDAIVFDLRDNRGGFPEMVSFLAAYLFDHPEYMYNPRDNTTVENWTRSPVPGNRLADKPVYILTSQRTISGAEQFSYDLKMLRRATLVGETTGGAAHAGVYHRIDEHFGMGIPETRAINPFSKTDWAETGVEPDVKAKAAVALTTAQKLAGVLSPRPH